MATNGSRISCSTSLGSATVWLTSLPRIAPNRLGMWCAMTSAAPWLRPIRMPRWRYGSAVSSASSNDLSSSKSEVLSSSAITSSRARQSRELPARSEVRVNNFRIVIGAEKTRPDRRIVRHRFGAKIAIDLSGSLQSVLRGNRGRMVSLSGQALNLYRYVGV
jgi:hypothetical protein